MNPIPLKGNNQNETSVIIFLRKHQNGTSLHSSEGLERKEGKSQGENSILKEKNKFLKLFRKAMEGCAGPEVTISNHASKFF